SIEIVELADPRKDEVLVRMLGIGICHTDLSCRCGELPTPMPILLCHVGSGILEKVGSRVSRVQVGGHDALSLDHCCQCPNCRLGNPATCFEFFPRNFTGKRLADGTTPITQNGAAIHAVFFSQSSFATHAIAREANTVVVDR